MNELPAGWSKVGLGDVAEFVMGQAPPGDECNKSGTGTPFVKAGEFGPVRPVIREWTTKPLKMARPTDVLICVVGATCGKLNLGTDCAIGRSVASIRPADAVGQDYLFRFLQTKVGSLRAASTGSAQGVISKEALEAVEVPLAPALEQRRIVARIDRLSAKAKLARDRLDHVPMLVERYKQTLLAVAFQGGLTSSWRTKHKSPLHNGDVRLHLQTERDQQRKSRGVRSKGKNGACQDGKAFFHHCLNHGVGPFSRIALGILPWATSAP